MYRQRVATRISLLAVTAFFSACAGAGGSTAPVEEDLSFAGPFAVTITGYDDHAMEPFLTRDGQYLLFNNRNAPADSTDLHIASRVNDSAFSYIGPLDVINSSRLDGVPTVASDGAMYFVSLRAYDSTFSTIFSSTLTGSTVTPPVRVASISTGGGGLLDFDVDVSADGQVLILARGRFTGGELPAEADLQQFTRSGDGFEPTPGSAALYAALNTDALEYAPAITADGLELCFTRFSPGSEPSLMLSRRANLSSAWGAPQRIRGPTGIFEAGTWSPDSRTLYYHQVVGGRYVIRRLVR